MPAEYPAPTDLRTEGRQAPLGLEVSQPEFSWHTPELAQEWYEVEVTDRAGRVVWQPGRQHSPRPFGVQYEGESLLPKAEYAWRVRIGDSQGSTEWSMPAAFETGIMTDEWAASWITDDAPTDSLRTLYFQGVDTLPAPVVRARAYASALGWYRLFINGTDVTGHALVPRWTPLDQYVEYQVYDVTDALREGRNVIDTVVADGRYRGRNGFQSHGRLFGDRLAVIVQIEAELADGSHIVISSDTSWQVGAGRISTADPKHGERVDLRVDFTAGSTTPIDARPAVILPPHERSLIGEEVERLEAISELPGIITTTPAGVTLVDFQQNFTGVARVRLAGTPGTTIRLSYSEVLTPDGELDVHYLDFRGRSKEWFQRDEVILGTEVTDYLPWFTYHGFRYLTIESLADDPSFTVEAVTGVVMSTPLRQTGTFESSHAGLNQLWSNVEWSLRSNFLDTPTDCPTRERSGWTGDIQIFGPTASIMVDADQYLRRYLRNLAAEQLDDGGIPTIIPRESSVFSGGKDTQYAMRFATGWGDTATILPNTLHTYFDDVAVLRRQYGSMRTWVDALTHIAATTSGKVRRFGRRAGDLERYVIDTQVHYGEWLRPGESIITQMAGNIVRPPAEVATAYFAHSARILARTAELIGEHEDARRYAKLADHVRQAYRAAFVRSGGSRIGIDKQDDYVRALALDLLEPEERKLAGDRLLELLEKRQWRLGTGFLSTPLLLPVLVEIGRPDAAYNVLLQTAPPSWLHQLGRGATTVWETWEGYDRKGNAKMSHNHYAFGSVAQWLFEGIVGVRPLEPGYRRFAVSPTPGGGLTHARGSLITRYGAISAHWQQNGDAIDLDITVPFGTTAEVRLLDERRELGPGQHRVSTSVAPAS
ncbi:family 78 glycoside hydrolase catalytic domain [Microbacterium sp. NPDC089696]|uniref:family 78 glycoside hydrolase catalytic domain n=1 Tax=Microbacterium sp. NPDC089696 TaxID=3364199 RepID=UPI003819BF8B